MINQKPKTYILFAGADYYPGGGWRDVVGTFTSVEEAIKIALAREGAVGEERPKYDWWQIVDLDTHPTERTYMTPSVVAEGHNPKEMFAVVAPVPFEGEKVAGTGASTGLFVEAIPKSKKRRKKSKVL